tara:strand:- start:2423 stop:2803 length:381 start_codon:yes stop_codon:yes gene_type:complete
MKQYKARKGEFKKFENNSNRQESRQKRGYGKEWYSYRARFLAANPKCYICACKSSVVDHLLRARGNPEHFENPENHCQLCASCHGKVTGMFDAKKDQDLEGKLKYIRKMREFYKTSHPIKIVKYRK